MSEEEFVLTVRLTTKSWAALTAVAERQGDTLTDTVNRAIQIADLFDRTWSTNGRVAIQPNDDAEWQEVKVF